MRQLRLRDIGGMILVDFIDMDKEAHKTALLQQMRQLAQLDRTKTNVVDITALGLVEITRKKSRQNLEHMWHTDCPICQGTGRIMSADALGIKVCREIRRIESRKHVADGYLLQLHSGAANELKLGKVFAGLERELGVRVEIEANKEILPGSYILLQK